MPINEREHLQQQIKSHFKGSILDLLLLSRDIIVLLATCKAGREFALPLLILECIAGKLGSLLVAPSFR